MSNKLAYRVPTYGRDEIRDLISQQLERWGYRDWDALVRGGFVEFVPEHGLHSRSEEYDVTVIGLEQFLNTEFLPKMRLGAVLKPGDHFITTFNNETETHTVMDTPIYVHEDINKVCRDHKLAYCHERNYLTIIGKNTAYTVLDWEPTIIS